MQESAINMGAFGFWIFLAVIGAGAIWTNMRKQQIRKDLIQAMLEKGKSVDVEEVNRLLGTQDFSRQNISTSPQDPRSPYRVAIYLMFFTGFFTLFVALKQDPPIYLLALLGALPLYLAVSIWHTSNKEYADGTLATLKYARDPREHWQSGGGWAFWIGYGTTFMAIYKYHLNIPLLVMGVAAIIIAFLIWRDGERQYAAGKIPINDPDSDNKPD